MERDEVLEFLEQVGLVLFPFGRDELVEVDGLGETAAEEDRGGPERLIGVDVSASGGTDGKEETEDAPRPLEELLNDGLAAVHGAEERVHVLLVPLEEPRNDAHALLRVLNAAAERLDDCAARREQSTSDSRRSKREGCDALMMSCSRNFCRSVRACAP